MLETAGLCDGCACSAALYTLLGMDTNGARSTGGALRCGGLHERKQNSHGKRRTSQV